MKEEGGGERKGEGGEGKGEGGEGKGEGGEVQWSREPAREAGSHAGQLGAMQGRLEPAKEAGSQPCRAVIHHLLLSQLPRPNTSMVILLPGWS